MHIWTAYSYSDLFLLFNIDKIHNKKSSDTYSFKIIYIPNYLFCFALIDLKLLLKPEDGRMEEWMNEWMNTHKCFIIFSKYSVKLG